VLRAVGHVLVPRLVLLGALLCATGGFTPGHLARAIGISDIPTPSRAGCPSGADASATSSGCDRHATATGGRTGWCPTGIFAAGADDLQSILHTRLRACWR
jgi:hypothetical protein